MASIRKASGLDLAELIGLSKEQLTVLLTENARFTAFAVADQVNIFIKKINAGHKGSKGAESLDGYAAIVKESQDTSVPITIKGAKFSKIYIPVFIVTVEAPAYHKKIKDPTSPVGHLHVFNLLNYGRKRLPRSSKGYTLFNLAGELGGRTVAAGRSQKSDKKGFIRRPVAVKETVTKKGRVKSEVIYKDVPKASLLTGTTVNSINRPEPRKVNPYGTFKSISVGDDTKITEAEKREIEAAKERISEEIADLRTELSLAASSVQKKTNVGDNWLDKVKERLIEEKRVELTRAYMSPVKEKIAQRLFNARKAKLAKESGVVFTPGPVRSVLPRNLYRRAVEQVKDKLSGRGLFMFQAVYVDDLKNPGRFVASVPTRDR
jgi:hypothetical protein